MGKVDLKDVVARTIVYESLEKWDDGEHGNLVFWLKEASRKNGGAATFVIDNGKEKKEITLSTGESLADIAEPLTSVYIDNVVSTRTKRGVLLSDGSFVRKGRKLSLAYFDEGCMRYIVQNVCANFFKEWRKLTEERAKEGKPRIKPLMLFFVESEKHYEKVRGPLINSEAIRSLPNGEESVYPVFNEKSAEEAFATIGFDNPALAVVCDKSLKDKLFLTNVVAQCNLFATEADVDVLDEMRFIFPSVFFDENGDLANAHEEGINVIYRESVPLGKRDLLELLRSQLNSPNGKARLLERKNLVVEEAVERFRKAKEDAEREKIPIPSFFADLYDENASYKIEGEEEDFVRALADYLVFERDFIEKSGPSTMSFGFFCREVAAAAIYNPSSVLEALRLAKKSGLDIDAHLNERVVSAVEKNIDGFLVYRGLLKKEEPHKTPSPRPSL